MFQNHKLAFVGNLRLLLPTFFTWLIKWNMFFFFFFTMQGKRIQTTNVLVANTFVFQLINYACFDPES